MATACTRDHRRKCCRVMRKTFKKKRPKYFLGWSISTTAQNGRCWTFNLQRNLKHVANPKEEMMPQESRRRNTPVVVRHTQWSLWMGPGFSDSEEEEEEKETAAHISDPKDNAVESFVNLKMSKFPSKYGSDSCPVEEETEDSESHRSKKSHRRQPHSFRSIFRDSRHRSCWNLRRTRNGPLNKAHFAGKPCTRGLCAIGIHIQTTLPWVYFSPHALLCNWRCFFWQLISQ